MNVTPGTDRYLPTSVKEMEMLGWDHVDVVLFSGDAYVDHPSFGAAVIGRTLQAHGYNVAIVPSPTGATTCATSANSARPDSFSAYHLEPWIPWSTTIQRPGAGATTMRSLPTAAMA